MNLASNRTRCILGIKFYIASGEDCVKKALLGGIIAVPSAPVLLFMQADAVHREALLNADLAIADSGAMVLMWRLLTGEKIPRVSGLQYIRLLLNQPLLRKAGVTAWIMPSAATRDRTITWLHSIGFPAEIDDFYLAPQYPTKGRIDDPALLNFIRQRQPKHVIIALGGCTQERLSWCLRGALDYNLGLHCIGAAIGFLTGDQVNIPQWADQFYLGWLFRCIHQPHRFVPRYWQARKLIPLMIRYRDKIPPLLDQ